MRPNLADRFRKYSFGGPNGDYNYYDRLTPLFEKTTWATLTWTLILNIISPISIINKNYTFLLIFTASAFNLFYFRYIYWRIRKQKYRYYLAEIIFPFMVWIYFHLHQELIPYILLPYFIGMLATSLTLRRFDSLLTLVTSVFLTFIETIALKRPLTINQLEIGLAQIFSLIIFSWVAINLADFIRLRDKQNLELLEDVNKESEKSSILRKYALNLVIDKEKAAILMSEANLPVLVIDSQMKIQDISPKFKELSDFKNDNLQGKNIDYVLKIDNSLDLSQNSYFPQDFNALLTTRRNKSKKVKGKAHFLIGQDGKVKQVLLIIT